MKPDARNHNPKPEYLSSLLVKAGEPGRPMGKRWAAELIGVSARDFRYMVNGDKTCPYSIQF